MPNGLCYRSAIQLDVRCTVRLFLPNPRIVERQNMFATPRTIKFTRRIDDIDGYETYEQVWQQTGLDSYWFVRHSANPKSGTYEPNMTPEELRQWLTEHPEGVTTLYDPVTHLPLSSL
jgi:hypothetical protein